VTRRDVGKILSLASKHTHTHTHTHKHAHIHTLKPVTNYIKLTTNQQKRHREEKDGNIAPLRMLGIAHVHIHTSKPVTE
jgi:hypothetical protein